MSLEFLGRLQRELSLTGSAVYESVVAIAERVNRKVHVLRLHGQAASLLMPMISPRRLKRGPPELPGLIEASVWMKFS